MRGRIKITVRLILLSRLRNRPAGILSVALSLFVVRGLPYCQSVQFYTRGLSLRMPASTPIRPALFSRSITAQVDRWWRARKDEQRISTVSQRLVHALQFQITHFIQGSSRTFSSNTMYPAATLVSLCSGTDGCLTTRWKCSRRFRLAWVIASVLHFPKDKPTEIQ